MGVSVLFIVYYIEIFKNNIFISLFRRQVPERVKPKVVGPIPLSKQHSRLVFLCFFSNFCVFLLNFHKRGGLALKSPCNPHESRFNVLKLSETWSNMK